MGYYSIADSTIRLADTASVMWSDSDHNQPERKIMYLTTLDLLAIMIALVVSATLVITSALANARLTRSVEAYREAYFNLKAGK